MFKVFDPPIPYIEFYQWTMSGRCPDCLSRDWLVIPEHEGDFKGKKRTESKEESSFSETDNILSSPDIPQWQLTREIKNQLSKHDFSISCYEPLTFIIAHRGIK